MRAAACLRNPPGATRALRRAWLPALLLAAALAGCDRPAPPVQSPQATPGTRSGGSEAPPQRALFAEIARTAGIDFTHDNGMSGAFHYAEIIGSGVAAFDADNDGRMDLLVLQGRPLLETGPAARCLARLYRNEGGTGRSLKFADVTERSGLCSRGYGMGLAVGDIDNDGCADVFVTHFGSPNQLWRNRCDGTFEDVTRRARLEGDGRWGASASFVDYDRDGRLDLAVTNYVKYAVAETRQCHAHSGLRDYCAPSAYPNVPGQLWRNLGGGRFEDVSAKSGITRAFGAGLGVMGTDLSGDGWPDIFVANDGNPNQLWINQKDGTFKDEALLRGAAVNADGAPEAGMGLDIGDFDNNGTDDIFMTHLAREKSTMFVNRGDGQFEDRSVQVGVAVPSMPYTGFGTAFIDIDNDGWLDIVQANGDVKLIEALRSRGDPYPLHQKKLMFRNLGNGKFEDHTAAGGEAFALSEVGRGLAAADLDNDGAVDFVVSNNKGPLRVFMNEARSPHAWIGLRLVAGKRDAHGARVELQRKDGPALWRRVRADGSYLSSNDPRIVFGLGAATGVEQLIVHWPDGRSEAFAPPPLKQYTTLVQGTGTEQRP